MKHVDHSLYFELSRLNWQTSNQFFFHTFALWMVYVNQKYSMEDMSIMHSLDLTIKACVCVKKNGVCLTVNCYELNN